MDLPHLSVSTIDGFNLCPRRAYLRKTDEVIGQTHTAATQTGSAVHAALEAFHCEGLGEHKDLVSLFKEVSRDYDIPDFGRYNMAVDFFKTYEHSPLAKANVIACEKAFDIQISGFKVIGYIDRIDYAGNNKYRIWDYKTSFLKKDEEELQDDLQLRTYDIAFREMFANGEFLGLPEPEVVECGLIYTRYGPVSTTYSEEERQETQAYIEYMGHRINMIDEEPAPRINTWCTWCEWKNTCPIFQDDFKEYLDLDVTGSVAHLAQRLQDLRYVKKIASKKIEEIQKNLIVNMEEAGSPILDSPLGQVKMCTNQRTVVNDDVLKARMPDWTRFASINAKLIEEKGSESDKEILSQSSRVYETAPFIRIVRNKK